MTFPGFGQKSPVNVEISVIEDRIEVACAGEYHRGDVLHLIDRISEHFQANPETRKCLVDVREAGITLGIMGEFVIGEYAAKKLGSLRIALIQAGGQIKKLMEDTAYNRGLRILMVETRQEARAWLDK